MFIKPIITVVLIIDDNQRRLFKFYHLVKRELKNENTLSINQLLSNYYTFYCIKN